MDDSISKPTGNDTNVDEPDHVTQNEVEPCLKILYCY